MYMQIFMKILEVAACAKIQEIIRYYILNCQILDFRDDLEAFCWKEHYINMHYINTPTDCSIA